MAADRRAWRQVIDEYVELQMVQFRADMSQRRATHTQEDESGGQQAEAPTI
jgi:hypothetical protein